MSHTAEGRNPVVLYDESSDTELRRHRKRERTLVGLVGLFFLALAFVVLPWLALSGQLDFSKEEVDLLGVPLLLAVIGFVGFLGLVGIAGALSRRDLKVREDGLVLPSRKLLDAMKGRSLFVPFSHVKAVYTNETAQTEFGKRNIVVVFRDSVTGRGRRYQLVERWEIPSIEGFKDALRGKVSVDDQTEFNPLEGEGASRASRRRLTDGQR